MSGEKDLAVLKRLMRPELLPGSFVYCCLGDGFDFGSIEPIITVREPEGLTAVLAKEDAEGLGLAYVFESRLIRLMAHSDLAAVGLLAFVAAALASAGIPCNAVAGYHHDHLLVPIEDGERALAVLISLSK
jgi:hypothetical protein